MVGSPPNQPKKAGSKRAKVSLNRGKPLSGKTVFLEFKNHLAAATLQQSLLSLGATIEDFLGPTVSFVVTDKTDLGNAASTTPGSVAAGTSPSSPALGSGETGARLKSRGQCMLNVARQRKKQREGTNSAFALARRWNIPVHTHSKVAASVERLSNRLKQPQASRIRLKAPFIKFESVARDSKPTYGELGSWPCANVSGPPGSSPFLARAARTPPPPPPPPRDQQPPRATHDVGPTARPPPAQHTAVSTAKTPRMTRKAVAVGRGHCELCGQAYDSLSMHLATEKHAREAGCVRNFAALDVLIASGPGLAFAERATKPGGARTRSMSGGKLYTPDNAPRRNGETQTQQRRHFNRCRRTQLALLSSEASSFMSRSGSDPADPVAAMLGGVAETRGAGAEGSPRRIKRRSSGSDTEPSAESIGPHRHGKRRSQAEAFICDNREYYKFETPGSRLRCHGETKGTTPPSEGGVVTPPDDKGWPGSLSEDRSVWFSFECPPLSEPWLAAFRRQDDGAEMYAPLPFTDPPFLLPYQLPPPLAGVHRTGGVGRRRRGGAGRPRKSPRKHASTLAILSTLVARRQQRASNGAAAVAAVVAAIPSQPIRGETDADLHRLANSLDAILDLSGDDLDLDPMDAPPLSVEPSVAELIQSINDTDHDTAASESSDWRRRKKKKRKNLTGWPNAKRVKPSAGSSHEPGAATVGRRLRSAVVVRRESPRKQRGVAAAAV